MLFDLLVQPEPNLFIKKIGPAIFTCLASPPQVKIAEQNEGRLNFTDHGFFPTFPMTFHLKFNVQLDFGRLQVRNMPTRIMMLPLK